MTAYIARWLRRVDKNVAVGLLIAVPSLVVGVSSWCASQEKRPEISFQIINEANVLDVHKPIEDLQVLFQGGDIQETSQNLRIYSLRLENRGGSDVLQTHYDQNDVWGFQVLHGKIIEVRLTEASSSYAQDNVNPVLISEDTVSFTKIILERGSYFTIETLVLHQKDRRPEIVPLGKIAGVSGPVAVEVGRDEGTRSFASRLFGGGVSIHVVRAVIYVIGFIAALFVAALAAIAILAATDYFSGRRLRGIEALPAISGLEEGPKRLLLREFRSRGKEGLKMMQALLSDEELMRVAIEKHNLEARVRERVRDLSPQELRVLGPDELELIGLRHPAGRAAFILREEFIIDELVDSNVVSVENEETVSIDAKFLAALDELSSV